MARFKIGHSFCLDDREFKILSGAIHYFRVQPEDWYHSLYNLKALGFNTVETYLPWNMHEPQKGVFDFQGILDIEAYLQTAQDLGLYAIIRPSPFICPEVLESVAAAAHHNSWLRPAERPHLMSGCACSH